MKTYTVHLPPGAEAEQPSFEVAERLEMVADGFTPLAFLLTPVWLLVNRLWLVLILYLAGMVALTFAMTALDVPEPLKALVVTGVHLVIGFEADEIRRWTLEHKGWRMVSVVSARDEEEGRLRFLEGWLNRTRGQVATAGMGGAPVAPAAI